ncbi:hypothetical protein HYV72_01080 [Candidatus Uhrbacteria bacterium]|nr:hypothetical protein [Candidatus Uhrbacteria bacterium]
MRPRLIRNTERRKLNPYYVSRTAVSPKQWIAGLFFLCVLVLVLLFLFAPIFQINNVVVEGGEEDTRAAVDIYINGYLHSKWAYVLPRSQRWLLDEETLKGKLVQSFPLADATITLKGREMHVRISERVRTYYLMHGDDVFAVDRTGYVIERIDDIERIQFLMNQNVPVIEWTADGDVPLGSRIIDETIFASIVYAIESVSAKTLLTPERAQVAIEEQRLNVITDAGLTLYLSLQRNMDTQLRKLDALLANKLVDLNGLTYIDLRYQNRLYYH